MGHGQNGVAFAADLYENTALFGLDRLVAEAIVFLTEIIRYFFREAGGTVDRQQSLSLFYNVFDVFLFFFHVNMHAFLLSGKFVQQALCLGK